MARILQDLGDSQCRKWHSWLMTSAAPETLDWFLYILAALCRGNMGMSFCPSEPGLSVVCVLSVQGFVPVFNHC